MLFSITAYKIFMQLFYYHHHHHYDYYYYYCYYYKMETIFMNTENSKTNEAHRFRLDLTDKLNLKDPKKNMALANLSIYFTWKNIKSEYKNNKFKISAPTWNDTLDLPVTDLILLQIFRIILNLSLKSMKF